MSGWWGDITGCLTYEVHGATILEFTFRNIWNYLQRVANKVINCFEPTVLDGSVRHEPADKNERMMRNMRCEVFYLSHNELPELMITGGKSEPQNLLFRGE